MLQLCNNFIYFKKKVYIVPKLWYNIPILENKGVNMKNEINQLLEAIADDYRTFVTRSKDANGYSYDVEANVAEFKEALTVKEGSKYIRIDTKNSVWGFINKGNDNFKVGDILKPAGYRAPALNKARGNILEKYTVAWTGPHYIAGYSAGGTRDMDLLSGNSKVITVEGGSV